MSGYDFQPLQNVMNNWAVELPDEPNFTFHGDHEPNNITMISGGKEMLRVAPDGFYIRGQKVPVDDKEAATVYNAFKEFLVWSRLSRE
jgi:hypothetical protein